MPQHRLNSDNADLPVTRAILDAAPRAGRGQHRLIATTARTAKLKAGTIAAFVGAIGIGTVGAAQAVAQPAQSDAPQTVTLPPNLGLPANVKLPENVKLPQNVQLPGNLKLPPQLEEFTRNALPPNALTPQKKRAVKPVSGTVTSGYGARWGTNHNGVDIANRVGTPIYAVTDGTVLESGPASGFGMWVRVRQDDGTTGVFGHVDQSFVKAGQKVHAGQQIATVGNRGQSTGPHLHYEVWDQSGRKINPEVWLHERGVEP